MQCGFSRATALKVRCFSRWMPTHPAVAAAAVLQVTATNVDIARVAPTYHLYTVDEVEGVIGRL